MVQNERNQEETVSAGEAPEPSRGELAGRIRITVRRLDRLEATSPGDRNGLGKLIS
jgi:hypothetical protein